MKQIHSYLAYFVLIALIIVVANAMIGLVSQKKFKPKYMYLGLSTLIFSHIQFLIGIGWYFMSPPYKQIKIMGMGEAMKDAQTRLLAIEHPTVMLIAIIFITIGWSKHKKQNTDREKFKTFAIYYSIALLLILSRIPWHQWL